MIHTGERPLRRRPEHRPGSFKETGVKPYSCEVCGAAFCEKRNLKRHIISLHEDVRLAGSSRSKDIGEGEVEGLVKLQQAPLPTKRREPEQVSYTLAPQTPLVLAQPQEVVQQVVQQEEPPQEVPQQSLTLQQVVLQQSLTSEEVLAGTSPAPQTITTQMPQLVLAQGPGQPPRPARPATTCQNHHAHVLTFMEGSCNQWQTWCFCDPPTPGDATPAPAPTISTIPAATGTIIATAPAPAPSPPPQTVALTTASCATLEHLEGQIIPAQIQVQIPVSGGQEVVRGWLGGWAKC